MKQTDLFSSSIVGLEPSAGVQHYPAETFPFIHPIYWLTSHFAVGGLSPLRRLGGMLTAHMTQIAPHNGFTWHPHRGLEIYTVVIDGQLYHEDTTGGRGVITSGEVQRMFSGHYIEHQELNLTDQTTRVIQIWFVAPTTTMGLDPQYEQIALNDMSVQVSGEGQIRHIIGPQGATDSHVNARLTSTELPAGGRTHMINPLPEEDLFLYVVDGRGRVSIDGQTQTLGLYDVVLASPSAQPVQFMTEDENLTFLSFYLPSFLTHEYGK